MYEICSYNIRLYVPVVALCIHIMRWDNTLLEHYLLDIIPSQTLPTARPSLPQTLPPQ